MTQFKKGDRVKVEFEGEVTQADRLGVHVKTTGGFSFVPGSTAVTLLERPVEPLAPGSVVVDKGSLLIVREDGVYRRYHDESLSEPLWKSVYTAQSLARAVADPSRKHTLIHDGGKK